MYIRCVVLIFGFHIIREIAKQREDLQRLQGHQTLDRDFIEWLRTSYNNDGNSLIDLSRATGTTIDASAKVETKLK